MFAGFVKCLADPENAAIHHVAGRDDVGSCLGERRSGFCEERHARVVFYFEVIAVAVHEAAVAMRGVFAKTNVGDDYERLCFGGGLDGSESSLDDAVGCPGAAALLVFLGGDAEEQHATDAQIGAGFDLLESFIDGEIEDAGHAADLAANALPFAKKEGIDERAGTQMRFSNQRAHGGGGAETAQTSCGKFHAIILWPLRVCVRNGDHTRFRGLGSVLSIGHGCVLVAAQARCEYPQRVDSERRAERKVDERDDSEYDCEDASPGLARE